MPSPKSLITPAIASKLPRLSIRPCSAKSMTSPAPSRNTALSVARPIRPPIFLAEDKACWPRALSSRGTCATKAPSSVTTGSPVWSDCCKSICTTNSSASSSCCAQAVRKNVFPLPNPASIEITCAVSMDFTKLVKAVPMSLYPNLSSHHGSLINLPCLHFEIKYLGGMARSGPGGSAP